MLILILIIMTYYCLIINNSNNTTYQTLVKSKLPFAWRGHAKSSGVRIQGWDPDESKQSSKQSNQVNNLVNQYKTNKTK